MLSLRHSARALLDNRLRKALTPFSDEDWRASALIVAPHPDDETLGCGGVACKKIARGARTHFAFVTDGSASHSKHIAPEALRRMREEEATEAARRLGASANDVTFLRFPDGEVATYVPSITAALLRLLHTVEPQSVYLPHAKDPPSDHAAVNAAARLAIRVYGRKLTVYEYPVWYWYHWPWVRLRYDLPGMWRTTARQTLRTRAGFTALSALNRQAFVGDVLATKRAALAAHVSQTRRPDKDSDWATLADLSGGDFVGRLMADYETFSRYQANA